MADTIREACLSAVGNQRLCVMVHDVMAAIKQLQSSLGWMIPETDYPAIVQTYYTKAVTDDIIEERAIANGVLLEYVTNGINWRYPHPMVIRSNAFQRALDLAKR